MIISNKLGNYFVVSADRQTFLGFEMTANLHDTSPLRKVAIKTKIVCMVQMTMRADLSNVRWNPKRK